ncbi:unnamed protein product [Acanthoscelides obtectus]|nr:unnamed protein product [Acanthoscelides obtectus]CAK1626184.1 Folliculin [Acanthoscelides obtectus]
MYFGDNKRGHIISHVFDVKDSFARGFKRKYCIVVLSQDQISLLQHYDFIKENLKKISSSIQQKASKVNTAEQSVHSQREVRQKEGYKTNQRSLALLTGEPNIFAHLHMWFVFLLRSEIYRSIPHEVPDCPVDVSAAKELRELYKSIPKDVFRTLVHCTVTGIKTEYYDARTERIFNQLLPVNFRPPSTESCICSCSKENKVHFVGCLPQKLPTLVCQIEQAISNDTIPEPALTHHLSSLIIKWLNIACVVNWAPKITKELLDSLEIRKCDMPVVTYWASQSNCVESCQIDWFEKV